MSTSEELGDSVTHFYKTGGVLRNRDDSLISIKALLPKTGPNNTRVEYDIWYDMNDAQRVHGYVYTDAMGKFIYLRVGDANRTHQAMNEAAACDVSAEGKAIIEDLALTAKDKYRLRSLESEHKKIAFLAGANILHKAVDWQKLSDLVDDGWKLKCHPLTSRDLRQLLVNKYGEQNILDKKLSGYSLLESAEEVACAENSEMGIVGVAKGKRLVNIGCGNRQLTYSAIYKQLYESQDKKETLTKIFSCEQSGLIPTQVSNPGRRVALFFDKYRDIPHVKPKSNNS